MKDDAVYLAQIKDAANLVQEYVGALDKHGFLADRKTQSAVILQLMLIGELAKRLSEETKLHINLPWKEIAGFRDNAIHEYFHINLDIVWDTIIEDVPLLKSALKDINI